MLIDKLGQAWPAEDWRDTTVVVAVSGGADSVALLSALHAIQSREPGSGKLVAAHFNHRLRGAESDADQAFVAEICRDMSIDLESNYGPIDPSRFRVATDEQPATSTDSQPPDCCQAAPTDYESWDGEGEARQLRYKFLHEIVARSGARFLATAHTADDQAETVLHRIIRGTGIAGLAGIPRVRAFSPGVTLVRPLLTVWRHEILDFLAHQDHSHREDSSNVSTRFTRNRLRRELLPNIQRKYNPRVKEALCRLATLAREVTSVVRRRVAELQEKAVRRRTLGEVSLDCNVLGGVEPYVIRELFMVVWEGQGWPLRDMSLEKWSQLADLVRHSGAPATKLAFPGNIIVQRAGSQLILRKE